MIWFWIILYLINACLYSVFTIIRTVKYYEKEKKDEANIAQYFLLFFASIILMPIFLFCDIIDELKKE